MSSKVYTTEQMEAARYVMAHDEAPSSAQRREWEDEALALVWWIPVGDDGKPWLCANFLAYYLGGHDEPVFEGFIKWDGCRQMRACTPHYGIHFDETEQMARWFAKLTVEVEALGREIPEWEL